MKCHRLLSQIEKKCKAYHPTAERFDHKRNKCNISCRKLAGRVCRLLILISLILWWPTPNSRLKLEAMLLHVGESNKLNKKQLCIAGNIANMKVVLSHRFETKPKGKPIDRFMNTLDSSKFEFLIRHFIEFFISHRKLQYKKTYPFSLLVTKYIDDSWSEQTGNRLTPMVIVDFC